MSSSRAARAKAGRSGDGLRLRGASRRVPRGQSGVALLESVVALGILAVGVLGVAAALLSSMQSTRRSHSLTNAMYLAEQQIEAFHTMPGADVQAMLGDPGYPNDPGNPIDPDPNDTDQTVFARRWNIQPNTPEAGVFTLTVQVDWLDQLGITRTVSVETMKADL